MIETDSSCRWSRATEKRGREVGINTRISQGKVDLVVASGDDYVGSASMDLGMVEKLEEMLIESKGSA